MSVFVYGLSIIITHLFGYPSMLNYYFDLYLSLVAANREQEPQNADSNQPMHHTT